MCCDSSFVKLLYKAFDVILGIGNGLKYLTHAILSKPLTSTPQQQMVPTAGFKALTKTKCFSLISKAAEN